MEDSLGIVLFHVIALQRDVLYPAALSEQQVGSWGQGVDIGSSVRSYRGFPTTMVDTFVRQTQKNRIFFFSFCICGRLHSCQALCLRTLLLSTLVVKCRVRVIDSHIGRLLGPDRVPEISCPFRSTHQQCPVLPWHCIGS